MNELQLITIRDRSGKLSGKDMHRLIKRAKEKINEHTTNNPTEHKGTTERRTAIIEMVHLNSELRQELDLLSRAIGAYDNNIKTKR